MEVEKQCGTGDTNTRCELGLTTVEVVTMWATGYTWAEALEMSWSAPGYLSGMLGLVLDALRHIDNLTLNSMRVSDVNENGLMKTSYLGFSSKIRNLSQDAAHAMNRLSKH